MTFLLAVGRGDVADFIETLALVFVVLIFIRVVMSFVQRVPYNRWLDGFLTFVTAVTDPILRPLRRVLPPVPLGGAALDLSPIVATILLMFGASILAELIR